MKAQETTAIGLPRGRETLLVTAWFGLVAGLLEASFFAFLYLTPFGLVRRWVVDYTLDVFWIAPLICLGVFLFWAALLHLASAVGKLLPPRFRPDITPILVFLFGATEIYVLLRLTGRIPAWGCFFLALGVAFQLARWFRDARSRWLALFRRTIPALAVVVGVFAVVLVGGQRVREAYLTRQLPAVPEGAPNVLLIVLDTLRADHLSSYGYGRATTPTLDRLSEEGTLFENAYAPSSWTLPSHASLLTGRAVSEHQADSLRPFLDDTFPTLSEFLASRGLVTAAFSANKSWVSRNTGLGRGFLHFEDYYSPWTDVFLRSPLGRELAFDVVKRFIHRGQLARKRAEQVDHDFLDWVDRNEGRPFFVLLNYYDTHAPYLSPEPYHMKFMDAHEKSLEPANGFQPPEILRKQVESKIPLWMAGYDGALAYTDAELGRLFDDLRRRGLLDNTLIIVTSDHGEAFGEHGLLQHTHSLYKEILHVPLILRWPGQVPRDHRVVLPVSLQNIPATIAALLFDDARDSFPGDSLSGCWTGNPAEKCGAEPVLSEVGIRPWASKRLPYSTGWLQSLVTPDWHLILRENGEVELFDRQEDAQEARNLADTPEGQQAVAELRQQLEEMAPLVSASGGAAGAGPR